MAYSRNECRRIFLVRIPKFSNGITWNGSAWEFVIQRSGAYLINGAVSFGAVSAGDWFIVNVRVNGGKISSGAIAPAGTLTSVTARTSDVIYLNGGDKVTLWITNNSGAGKTIATGQDLTYLSIAKI